MLIALVRANNSIEPVLWATEYHEPTELVISVCHSEVFDLAPPRGWPKHPYA